MDLTVNLWSKAYSPVPDTNRFTALVNRSLWQKSVRDETSNRGFLRIIHPHGLHDLIVPIGDPVDADNTIYLPLWLLDSSGLQGEGEEVNVTILDQEAFPPATQLVFKVIDSAFYSSDVKDELEKALTQIGVIRRHTTLQIPVTALGGFLVDIFVANTEPAEYVLCDGEVAVEFEEPVDQVEAVRPGTPIPPEVEAMIPLPITGFVPFSGSGNTLGSSNAGPPWYLRK